MTTLTLKQVPRELIEELRAAAAQQRRSVNQHAIHLLEQAMQASRPSFAEAFAKFRKSVGPMKKGYAEAFEGLRSKEPGRKVRF